MMYEYICPKCGHEWESETGNDICPACNYWSQFPHYFEDGMEINGEAYKAIRRNVYAGLRYDMKCNSCGKEVRFYYNHNLECSCECPGSGFYTLPQEPYDYPTILKDYRERMKYSQSTVAGMLGISQTYYSMIEKGIKPVDSSSKLAKRILQLKPGES